MSARFPTAAMLMVGTAALGSAASQSRGPEPVSGNGEREVAVRPCSLGALPLKTAISPLAWTRGAPMGCR